MENINNQSLTGLKEQGKDNEFSLFIKPITNNKPLKNVTIDEVYEVVKGDYYKEVTDKLRNETNKDTQKNYKASELDYVCFSGTFVTRKNTDLEKHSNLLCIDFDDLNEVESTKEKIINTLPPRLLFRSPSGNGLKVVYPIDTSTKSHLDYFNYFESFFKDKLGLEIDKACKDVARACFLCHDPQAYKNENSPTITIQTPQQMSYDVIIENLEKWLQNKGEHFVNGNRNNYSTQLANALNRYGVPENETLNHLFLYAQEDFPQSEIQATVRSVYNHTEWHGISTFDENKPYAFPKGEEAEKEEKTPLLPIDGFPKFLQDYINEFKRVYNTPRDYIAGAVLFAVAFAIGDKLELVRKYKNIPLLWMATVGDVSTQKSMPTNTVLSYFRDRDNKEYSSFSKAITEYEKLKPKEKRETKEPTFFQYLLTDYTPEALYKVHQTNNRGLCIYRDELMGWFEDFGRYSKSGEQSSFLSMFFRFPYSVNRATKNPIVIQNTTVYVTGGIQPDLLPKMAEDGREEGGFLARFLFIYPDNAKKEYYSKGTIDHNWDKNFQAILEALSDLPETTILSLTEEAEKVHERWYNNNADITNAEKSSYLRGVYGKLDVTILRIAVVLHGMKIICDNVDDDEISAQTMKEAAAINEYFRKTAIKVYKRVYNGKEYAPTQPINDKEVIGYLSKIKGASQNAIAKAMGVTQPYINKILTKTRL